MQKRFRQFAFSCFVLGIVLAFPGVILFHLGQKSPSTEAIEEAHSDARLWCQLSGVYAFGINRLACPALTDAAEEDPDVGCRSVPECASQEACVRSCLDVWTTYRELDAQKAPRLLLAAGVVLVVLSSVAMYNAFLCFCGGLITEENPV